MMQLLLFMIVIPIVTVVVGIVISLIFKGFDRRFAAYYQSRIGPPILQPFYDLRKLMMKQNIVPDNAVKWIFNGAPLLALVSSLVLLFYVWTPYFAGMMGIKAFFYDMTDVIFVLYMLMIPAIAMIVGGFSSGSPYASVGAQREVVILISTELPLAITVVAFGWRMNMMNPGLAPFSINTIAENPIWQGMGPLGIIGILLLLVPMIAIIPAELAKIPFDQAEAETEIAEGLLAEYSGKNLAFFQIAEGAKSLALTTLIVVMFFPWGLSDIFGKLSIGGLDLSLLLDTLFFLLKTCVVYFIAIVTMRVSFARLKIQQVSKLFVVILSAIGFAGLLLMKFDMVFAPIPG